MKPSFTDVNAAVVRPRQECYKIVFVPCLRPSYGFRGWIGRGRFPVEAGRYHVYVGNTCPWCHRAVLAIVLRGLSPGVTFSYMDDSELSYAAANISARSSDCGGVVDRE